MTASTIPSTISAVQLAQLLQPSLPENLILLDARSKSLHAVEHILHSQPSPDLTSLPPHTTAVVYDSGSVSLAHTFSLSARLIARLHPTNPSTTFLLLVGGLPAMRAAAPHLIHHDAHAASLRLPCTRWAARALAALTAQHEPPAPVLPWLYVGGVHHARPPPETISHVLVVAAELAPPTNSAIVSLHIPALDTPCYDLKRHFPQIVDFISRARQQRASLLVHCFAGSSRSVAAVAAYLIATGVTLDAALSLIRSRRRAASPNKGFMRQLEDWERDLRAPIIEQRMRRLSSDARTCTASVPSATTPLLIPKRRTDPFAIPIDASPTTPLLQAHPFPDTDVYDDPSRSSPKQKPLEVAVLALPAPALQNCVSDISDGDQFDLDDAMDDSLRSLQGRLL